MNDTEDSNGEVYDIELLNNNNILIGGHFDSYSKSKNLKGLLELNPDGSINKTYNILNEYTSSVVTDIEKIGKKLYLAGSFIKDKNNHKNIIERPAVLINKRGLNNKFNHRTSILEGIGFKLVKDKKSIILVGDFISRKNNDLKNIVKVSKNGKIDKTFHIKVDGPVYDAQLTNNNLTLKGDFAFDPKDSVFSPNLKNTSSTLKKFKRYTIKQKNIEFDTSKFGTNIQVSPIEEYPLLEEDKLIMQDEFIEEYPHNSMRMSPSIASKASSCTPYIAVANKTRDYWYGKQVSYAWTRVNGCGTANYIQNIHHSFKRPGSSPYPYAKKRYHTNYLASSNSRWFNNFNYLITHHYVNIAGRTYKKSLYRRY